MYFRNYGLRKAWLDICLKGPVLEDPSTSNVGNGLTHCSNLDGSTFTIFINPSEGNFVGKTLF